MKRTRRMRMSCSKNIKLSPLLAVSTGSYLQCLYREQGHYPDDDVMLTTEAPLSLPSISVAIPSATTLITWQWCCVRTDSREHSPASLDTINL